MKDAVKWFHVLSPDMVFFPETPYEPEERGRCYVSVCAKTKRQARVKAIQHPDMAPWVRECQQYGENPFVGLEVTEAEDPTLEEEERDDCICCG